MLLIVSKVFCEFEKRRTEDTNHDRVVRFSVFCHAWSGVYLLSEAFIAAGCTQFVVMTIVTTKNNMNIAWTLLDRLWIQYNI